MRTDIGFYTLLCLCSVFIIGMLVAATCMYHFLCGYSLGVSILYTVIVVIASVLVSLLTNAVVRLIIR